MNYLCYFESVRVLIYCLDENVLDFELLAKISFTIRKSELDFPTFCMSFFVIII